MGLGFPINVKWDQPGYAESGVDCWLVSPTVFFHPGYLLNRQLFRAGSMIRPKNLSLFIVFDDFAVVETGKRKTVDPSWQKRLLRGHLPPYPLSQA